MLFKKKNDITIHQFIAELKNGNRDFFDILKLKHSDFTDATVDQLLSNMDDVMVGVNRVQKKFNKTFFGIFNGCLIKHHNNGDIKIIFYTDTDNDETVSKFSDVFFEELGNGLFDNTRFTPFTEKQKIKAISQGFFTVEKDEMVHTWLLKEVAFVLQYRIDPLQQFSLMVTISKPKQIDRSVRKNGTILNLLQFNPNEVLLSDPTSLIKEGPIGKEKFVDYTYSLDQPELNIFDTIRIRIFDSLSVFRKEVQTHITLYCSGNIPVLGKIDAAEKLIQLYGPDNNASEDLQIHEIDILEENQYWLGRNWYFNEQHGLWDSGDKNQTISYQVELQDWQDEEGFRLHISAYDKLVSLFGPLK